MLQFFEQQLVKGQMVSAHDRAIYEVVSSPEEASRAILGFYRVYHSSRYVGGRLVLRLQRPLPGGAVGQLTHEFRDALSAGAIEQGGALPQEADEPGLAALPRLMLRFNRKDFGRLTQLIHRINALGSAGC